MRLIDVNALIAWFKDLSNSIELCNSSMEDIFEHEIKSVSNKYIVDAEPVKHGHWIHDETGANYCSECNEYPYDDGEYHLVWHTDYCPHCGAKMVELFRDV